jgi:hypothetical protein
MTTPLAYSVAIPADPERNVYVRQAYRTKTSFVAVHFNPAGKGEIGFLPAGAILRIIGPSSCLREGFEVMFEEQVYSVFKVDLLAQCSQAQNWQGAALSEPALRQRGMIMAICTCCGTETQLFDTGLSDMRRVPKYVACETT